MPGPYPAGLGNMDTGFLDGTTGRDIVDCYELWVRLSHLTHRSEAGGAHHSSPPPFQLKSMKPLNPR